tara:strand:- start:5599 stop:6225 length:627 start_codon:yes stop_codon:yes gene_type:complete
MTNEQNEREKTREDMRKLQLNILHSKPILDLYLAAAGRNTSHYGEAGKATENNYIRALSEPDKYATNLITSPYLEAAKKARENGENIYESGVAPTSSQLLKNAQGFYQSALTKIKVNDILKMMGIKNVHEKNISKEQRNMYMEDFAEANQEMYKTLLGHYLGSIEKIGVGKAIAESGQTITKNLETILKEDPENLRRVANNPEYRQTA